MSELSISQRVWLSGLFLSATLLAGGGCRNMTQQEEPLSVALSSAGYIYGNRITIDSSGNGTTVSLLHTGQVTSFKVSKEEMSQLRQTINQVKFFDLDSEYGDNVPDGGSTRIRISLGEKQKLVTILFLGNWERTGHEKLAEAQNAGSVIDIINNWSNRAIKNNKETSTTQLPPQN